jgi:hypothetical protein
VCHVAFRFCSHGGWEMRRIGTRRAPLVTGSRVASSGVTGDTRPGLGRLGEQVGAERRIRRGVEADLPARAADRSIPPCASGDANAEMGGKADAAQRIAPQQGTRGGGRQADSPEKTGPPEPCRRSLTGPEVRAGRRLGTGGCTEPGTREPALRGWRTVSAQSPGEGSSGRDRRLNRSTSCVVRGDV